MLISFSLSSFIASDREGKNREESVRTINANAVYSTISEEVGIQSFLNRFDSYDCTIDEDEELIIVRETKHLDGILEVYETYISYANEEIEDEEEIEWNNEDGYHLERAIEFTIVTTGYDEDGVITSEEYYTPQLYFDEWEDEYYLDVDGELIAISDVIEIDVGALEECIAIADDIVVGVAALAVAAAIICYPKVKTMVQTVVKTVINRVKTFWRWLTRVFTTKVVTTTVTTVLYYTIRVFERDFDLEKVETADEPPRTEGEYYLAFILGSDVYISMETISENEAVEILSVETKISVAGEENFLNTYTYFDEMAENVAQQAAENHGLVGAVRHSYHGEKNQRTGTWFQHYHPGMKNNSLITHSFFGAPLIRE